MIVEKENSGKKRVSLRDSKELEDINYVRTIMLSKGISTFTKLAQLVGVDRSRISRIANRKERANEEMKIKIAQILETDSRIIFPTLLGKNR